MAATNSFAAEGRAGGCGRSGGQDEEVNIGSHSARRISSLCRAASGRYNLRALVQGAEPSRSDRRLAGYASTWIATESRPSIQAQIKLCSWRVFRHSEWRG